jgi:hypothetical protein
MFSKVPSRILLSIIIFTTHYAHGSEVDVKIFNGLHWEQDINEIKIIIEKDNAVLSNDEVTYEYKMNKKRTIGNNAFDMSFIVNGQSKLISIMAVSNYSSKRIQDISKTKLKKYLVDIYGSSKQGFKNSNSSITTDRIFWNTKNSFIALTITQNHKSNNFLTMLTIDKGITPDDDVDLRYTSLQEDKVMIAEWANIPILVTLRTYDDIKFITDYSKYVYDPASRKQKLITTLWQQDRGTIYNDDPVYTSQMRSHKDTISVFSAISPVSGCMLQFHNLYEEKQTSIEPIEKLRALKTPARNIYYDSCSGALYDSAGRSIITGAESPNLNIPKYEINSYTINLSIMH